MELPAGRAGERRRLRQGGFASRAAAERARSYWLGADVDPDLSLVTVGQWLDIWLESRYHLRPATRAIYRQLHAQWRRRTGGAAADGWVFAHADGQHWSPSYVTHVFERLVRDAGLPPIRFHDLRHGAASLSLAAGNELKVAQAMLGHDSIVLTADTYTSVLPCIAHQAAEATAALVRQAARPRWLKTAKHRRARRADAPQHARRTA